MNCAAPISGLIPLSHLALAVGVTADELADRLHDRTITEDAGTCCVTVEHARAVLADHATRQRKHEP